ncbi:unnamed protein product [Ixodes hexagonus]
MVSFPKSWSLSSRHNRRGPRYARGQTRTTSESEDQLAFVFADDEDSSLHELNSGDEAATELRLRSSGQNNGFWESGDRPQCRRETPVFEHKIVEGETLQGLALRYGCSVGTLRHLNNLLSDQDFFALVVLKVPARIHNLVTAKLVEPLSQDEETISLTSDGAESPPDKAIRYWANLDRRVEAALQQGNGDSAPLKDTIAELGEQTATTALQPPAPSAWSGADCGIGWCGILVSVATVGVVVPSLYLLYILLYGKNIHEGLLR